MDLGLLRIEVVVVVLLASAVAALTDVWRFKVYNVVTLPVFFSGLVYHTVTDGWSGLGLSTLGASFGLAVFMLPYILGGMGAGDVKFVAALGAWLGIKPLAIAVFFGCMATGIYALVLTIAAGGIRQMWFNFQMTVFRLGSLGRLLIASDRFEHIHDWTNTPDRRKRLIPFSAMMALGVAIAVGLTFWLAKPQ